MIEIILCIIECSSLQNPSSVRFFYSRSHLNGHPGLNRVACGGDITLAFTYKPSFVDDEETSQTSVKTKVLTSENIDKVYITNLFYKVTLYHNS
jgi:hypothetical protein